jgi:uncharacterized alpha/beta hydrolase family protein
MSDHIALHSVPTDKQAKKKKKERKKERKIIPIYYIQGVSRL